MAGAGAALVGHLAYLALLAMSAADQGLSSVTGEVFWPDRCYLRHNTSQKLGMIRYRATVSISGSTSWRYIGKDEVTQMMPKVINS